MMQTVEEYPVIAADLDGTLIDEHGNPFHDVSKGIRYYTDRNGQVPIVTGKDPETMFAKTKRRLSELLGRELTIAHCGGSLICGTDGEFRVTPLNEDRLDSAVNLLIATYPRYVTIVPGIADLEGFGSFALGQTICWIDQERVSEIGVVRRAFAERAYPNKLMSNFTGMIDFIRKVKPVHIYFSGFDEGNMPDDDFMKDLEVLSTPSGSLEIYGVGSKAKGIEILSQMINVPVDKMIFIGNGIGKKENDYSVFMMPGLAYKVIISEVQLSKEDYEQFGDNVIVLHPNELGEWLLQFK